MDRTSEIKPVFEPKKLARPLDFAPVRHFPVQLPATVRTVIHSLPNPALLSSATVLESPKRWPSAAAFEIKNSTPKKQKHCNCKHSRCLKLYCECFVTGSYCDGCNCLNCHNNVDHEATRQESIVATLERKPNAFRSNIVNSPHGTRIVKQEVGMGQAMVKDSKGCNCKKIGCLKKYCECFQSDGFCNDNCKCLDCKNYEGIEERHSLIHAHNYNDMIYQATNATVNGAIGSSGYWNSSSSRKRKYQDSNHPFFYDTPCSQGYSYKNTTSPLSSIPIYHGNNGQALLKAKYKSPLAGVIQPQDVEELCSLLLFASKETAKAFADEQDVRTCVESADNSGLSEKELENSRPDSPGTMALLCDEQDIEFMEGFSSRRPIIDSQNTLPETSNFSESYFEQERVVLSNFRDFLNRLITSGSIKETMCSSQARNEPGIQGQPVNYGV